jgi:hypothetical protein
MILQRATYIACRAADRSPWLGSASSGGSTKSNRSRGTRRLRATGCCRQLVDQVPANLAAVAVAVAVADVDALADDEGRRERPTRCSGFTRCVA